WRLRGCGADRDGGRRSDQGGRHRNQSVLLMRLKLGRPDINRFSDRFDVPGADAGTLSATWLGVATLLLDDGSSALMTDGFFSRPGLTRIAAGKLAPSEARAGGCLAHAKA